MAQRGRKPDPLPVKVARGTVKPTSDVLAQMRRVPDDVPQKADFLGPECDAIWEREIGNFVAGGATLRDSAYVSMVIYRLATFEKQAELSQNPDIDPPVAPPPITLTEQLRICLEGFGMAGPKSRATAGSGRQPAGRNLFATNGNRSRA
jgi:hypothetical protein